MRIGIDTRELMGRPTGVGRYLAELLREWSTPSAGVAGRHDFVLYGPAPMSPAVAQPFSSLGAAARIVPGGGGTWWEQVSLPAAASRDQLDLFFAPAYTSPLRLSCPITLTIHDLSFFAHPEWFRRREGFRRRFVTRRSARRAAVVLTDSEFSRAEVQSHLGIPADRIRVVHLGAAAPACFGSADSGPVPAGPERTVPPTARDPLVLFVGSVFNRRRVPDVIASFPAVVAQVPDARLEIVGENRTYPHQDLAALSRAAGLGDRTCLRSYVADAGLADAFRRASVFVFLSEYEGFGLTPLEALSCGIPIVMLDTPVAREVCGPAALYVAPGDLRGIAAAIVSLIRDSSVRSAVLAAAPGVLSRYSWAAAARMTMDALESAGR